jgi:hypothetical protein
MGDRVVVMRNGLLQQVDKPQVLYERPRNLFVAEFIGSPAMNLVVASSRAPTGTSGAVRRPPPPLEPATLDARPALADYEDRGSWWYGRAWRTPPSSADQPDRRISVLCDIREDMGSEVYAPTSRPNRSRRRRSSGARGRPRGRKRASRPSCAVPASPSRRSGQTRATAAARDQWTSRASTSSTRDGLAGRAATATRLVIIVAGRTDDRAA